MASLNVKGSLVAGVLAAIGASICCVGPLVLLTLGIGGAWVSSLTALEPARPFLVAGTLLFVGLAFRRGCTWFHGFASRAPPVPTRARSAGSV